MKEKRKSIDFVLFIVILTLLAVGLVMIFSASMVTDLQNKGDGYHHLKRQAIWSVLGIAAMIFASNIDFRVYRNPKFIKFSMIFIIICLIAVLFTRDVKGASRWLGFGGLSFQPSELAKIILIIFLDFKSAIFTSLGMLIVISVSLIYMVYSGITFNIISLAK